MNARNALDLYPNPTKNVVNILTGEHISSISVMNPEGKTIGIPIDYKYKQLDFSHLPNGVYFIRINTPKGTYNKKLVVSRD